MAILRDDDNRVLTDDRAEWADTEPPPPPLRHAARRGEPEVVVVRKNSAGQTIRIVLATAIVLAIAGFALLNTEYVSVDTAVTTFRTSIAALVGITAGAAFVAGWLLGFRVRRDPVT